MKARPSWYICFDEDRLISKRSYLLGAVMITQYTKAQYQHSTKNGNLSSSLLRRRSRNTAVFGDTTSHFHEKNSTSRLRQAPCWARSSDGEDGLQASVVNSPSSLPSEELKRSRLMYFGGLSREGFLDRWLRQFSLRDRDLGKSDSRLIQVPPKRSTMTTRGSRKAPTLMLENID